jgi:NitT/TauT family transport system substrate-binding protein
LDVPNVRRLERCAIQQNIVNKTSRQRFLTTATAAGAVVAGGFPNIARAQALDKVSVGIVNTSSDAVFFVADKLGYFRDAGIEVTLTPFQSTPMTVAPLGVGQLDVAGGSPSGGFYNGFARGINIRMVANKSSCPPKFGSSPLVVRTDLVKSGAYKTPRDLKGMKVAEPGPGGVTSAELYKLLVLNGLSYTDVMHIYMGFPDQVAALSNGAIDASLLDEPSASLAVERGVCVRVAANDSWYPYQDHGELLYGPSMIARRDVGMRFMVAFLRAARFYMGGIADGKLRGPNASRIIDILTEATSIKSRTLYSNMVSNAIEPNGKINVDSLSEDLAFYKSAGFCTADIKVAQTLDDSYQLAALKKLGTVKSFV